MSQHPTTPDLLWAGLTQIQIGLGAVAILLLLVLVGVRAWLWMVGKRGLQTSDQQSTTTVDEQSLGPTRMQIRPGAVALLLLPVFLGVKAWFWLGSALALEPGDQRVVLLVNQKSGRCLSVRDESTDPEMSVVQGPTPDRAGVAERWVLLEVSKGVFRLLNEHSGKVVEIPGGSKEKGVKAQQADDGRTQPEQHWAFERVGDNYILRAKHSQLVLAVGRGAMEAGAPAIQWRYLQGVADQLWKLQSPRP
jgi:hypothetical protein